LLVKPFYGCDHAVLNNLNITSNDCSKSFDVFILLDITTDIEQNEFDLALLEITNFIRKANIGSESTRLGLFIFSDSIKSVISINSNESKQEMINRIETIEQSGNFKNMKKAIHKTKLMIRINGNREENSLVHRVVIFLTNGLGINLQLIQKELNTLKNLCQIITVGVGKMINKKILKLLASCPDYLISLDKMLEFSHRITCLTCAKLPLNTRVKLQLNKEEKQFLKINIINFNKFNMEILDLNLKTIYGSYVYFYSFSNKFHQNFFDPSFEFYEKNEKLEENFRFLIPHGVHNLFFTIKGVDLVNKFEIEASKYSFRKYYINYFK
ncbi:collagen alpha-1(XII) chain-like, partial [Brachionus plicatilis]